MTDIHAAFSNTAQSYDRTRRQLIPRFDDFYGTAIELIPFDKNASLNILDLGAGTGLLTALVSEVFPNAKFTLSDFSEAMLDKAKQRFNSPNISYQISDYINEPIEGEYDVIMSALSIHHTPHELVPALFTKIYNALKTGGIFINADQVLGATPQTEAIYHETWLRQVQALGCPEEDLALSLERIKRG